MRLRRVLAGILVAGIAFTTLPCNFSTAEAVELPAPVLKVTFDDATATDLSGNGNDGSIIGDPEFVKGVSGKAIHIANSSSAAGEDVIAEQHVNFGQPEDLKFGAEDFSLVFWFKTDPHTTEGAVVSNKDWSTGDNPGFNLGDMNQGLNLNFNTSTKKSRVETDRFARPSDGKWHHIAATFDRDSNMILYIDGEILPAGNYNSNSAVQDISGHVGSSIDVANFVLGADGNFKYGASSIYIDELSVYKTVLTQKQVQFLRKTDDPEPFLPVLDVSFDTKDASDASKYQNHGEIIGNPEFIDGISGQAIHLVNPDGIAAADETALQYINFGRPETLQFGTNDFTIMFWYMSDGNNPEEVSVISNKDWSSGYNEGFVIGDMADGMTLNFRAKGAGGRLDTGRYGGATEKGKWHHIAAVFNRSGNMILYVDGQNADSKSIMGQAGRSIDVGDFILGADGLGKYGVKDSYIDELKVYRIAMTQGEISSYCAPYSLQKKIAEYEKITDEYTASQDKIDKFKKAISEVRKQAEGITDLDKIEELNEVLRKAYNEFIGPEEGIIHFEVISDTHIPGTNNANAANQKLIDVLDDLKRDYPDSSVVLHGGDFSLDGYESQVEGYFNILENYADDFTFMTALGNHEVRWKSGWDEAYERYMRYNGKYMGETNGKVYYDKWIDGYHFIVLNTEWDIKDRAYISQEQLDWLDKKMAENSEPSKPIFVVLHQPTTDTWYNSNEWSMGVQDYALKEVLRKYPQTIMFTGHLHNGLGAMDVVYTDYGTMVDIPSLKDNDQGDRRGQLGYHVTVYSDKVRLDLRDYLNNEWIPEYSYTINMDPESFPSGKILDVNFDDGTATDISGHENSGILVGNPEFVDDGHGGKALHIVNSETTATQSKKAEQFVDFGDNIRFGEDDFTIMFSYKGGTSGNGDGCVIANKNWDTKTNPGFAVGAFAGSNSGIGLDLNAEGYSGLNTNHYSDATDGNWHDIAATFDRDGEMTLYIDGQKSGSTDISSLSGQTIDVDGLHLVLAADGNCKNAVRDMYIDNLKIYQKVLGAAEIETSHCPYNIETTEDSVTVLWELTDDKVEPAYLVVDGKKAADIMSGEPYKTITGLTPGKEYTILLVNHEKSNPNYYQDVYQFHVKTKALGVLPETPENIVVECITENSAEVSWNMAEHATGYQVYLDEEKIGVITSDTHMILAGLKAGTTYKVSVVSVNKDGESERSPVVEFTTQSAKADKSVLNKLLTDLEAKNLDMDKYTEKTASAYLNALEKAKQIMNDDSLSAADQKTVDDAVQILKAAMDALELKDDIGASKAMLERFLNEAKQHVASGEVDGLVESVRKLFADAIAQGEAVMAKENAIREEIQNATTKLMFAIHALEMKAGDKAELEMALELAEKIDLEQYVEAGKDVYLAALSNARTVLEDGDAFQEDVDAVWEALVEALGNLRLKVNKDVLEELLKSVEGLDLNLYTEESVQAFKAALAKAMEVMEDDTLSESDQQIVDNVVKALADAKSALEKKDDNKTSNSGKDADKKGDSKAPTTGDYDAGFEYGVLLMLAIAGVLLLVNRKRTI